jgi:hypothetical protein
MLSLVAGRALVNLSIVITVGVGIASALVAYLFSRKMPKKPDLRSAVDFDRILSPGDWLTRGKLKISFDELTLVDCKL